MFVTSITSLIALATLVRLSAQEQPGLASTVHGEPKVSSGVKAPRAIYTPDPEYSEEARRAKLQGTCVLWVLVGADGKPHDVRVARSLGMGLDEKSIEAIRSWRFEPATKDSPSRCR
jgi:TonB family protein